MFVVQPNGLRLSCGADPVGAIEIETNTEARQGTNAMSSKHRAPPASAAG